MQGGVPEIAKNYNFEGPHLQISREFRRCPKPAERRKPRKARKLPKLFKLPKEDFEISGFLMQSGVPEIAKNCNLTTL